ncbi:hypothetical protein OS175_14900 [Marinicella sp. S1101]|nr:hypothetical protein [Marinicella marina]
MLHIEVALTQIQPTLKPPIPRAHIQNKTGNWLIHDRFGYLFEWRDPPL